MIRSIAIVLFLILYFTFSIPVYVIEKIIGYFNKDAMAKSSQWIVCNLGFKPIIFLAGTKVIVKGIENVPKDGPVLYTSNHRSYFDIVIGYTLAKNNTGFVAKKSMEKLPFFNIWMRYINCQFLDRSDVKQGLQTILNCIDLVKSGTSIWICPEGTRSTGDTLLPFKEGSFKIAERTGCPIIPVAITNTDAIFENHEPFVKKQTVVFEFGQPIDITAMDRKERKHVGAQVQEIIRQMLEKNRSLV